jgi:hypothetical protein
VGRGSWVGDQGSGLLFWVARTIANERSCSIVKLFGAVGQIRRRTHDQRDSAVPSANSPRAGGEFPTLTKIGDITSASLPKLRRKGTYKCYMSIVIHSGQRV